MFLVLYPCQQDLLLLSSSWLHSPTVTHIMTSSLGIYSSLMPTVTLCVKTSIKWPSQNWHIACHRVAWRRWSGQTSFRWWSCWLVLWLSSLGERCCRAAWQRSGKMRAKGAGWRRLSKSAVPFTICVTNGSRNILHTLNAHVYILYIWIHHRLQLWPRPSAETHLLDHRDRRQHHVGVHLLHQPVAGAALHLLQNPATRKDVSTPAPAAACVSIRAEQSGWRSSSVSHASGLCTWTWLACGSPWVWPCSPASQCSPSTRTATRLQTGMWTAQTSCCPTSSWTYWRTTPESPACLWPPPTAAPWGEALCSGYIVASKIQFKGTFSTE